MNARTEISGLPVDPGVNSRWIFDRLEDWARKGPQRCAFVLDHSDRVEEYTFADVLRFTNHIAAGLEARGIRRGDRVGILMENVPHWVFALLGVLRIGGVVVPLATALPEPSLKRLCAHSECRLVFSDSQNLEKARCISADVIELPADRILSFEGAPTPFQQPRDDETALIIYTSGTTGDPKGVELTALNLAHEIRGCAESLDITERHRILSVLPFSHVLPLVANGLGPLCIGAAVVFLSSVSPQRIVEAFRKHRITSFVCVPQFFYVLHKRIFSQVAAQPYPMRKLFWAMYRIAGSLRKPELRRKLFSRIHKTIGTDLRFFASGGSRFDPAVAKDLDRLGYNMLQAYGLTETSAAATATPPEAMVIGSVGKAIRGVSVKIDSPDANGVGEICIAGPILMKGYYKDEQATRAVLSDGWFHSGDLGYLRSDGNLVITGRSKDVIVLANGKNVYPEELEAHYSQSVWIKELCVLGISEAEGERLHAVVVPDMEEFRRRSQTTIAENIQVDIENLSKQLPSYYRILSFSIRNEPFPRTVTRKLQRFEIQREEEARQKAKQNAAARRDAPAEHERFKEGAGAVVAQLVRQRKPDAGPLDVSMSLELDLGFDSLARVELLGLAESQLRVRIEEEKASSIYTLGELVDALAAASAESGRGKTWREILDVPAADPLHRLEVLDPSALTLWSSYISIKVAKVFFRVFLPLRYTGIEKLPREAPFILCPNHQSFLDGPLLISTLPKWVIDKIFILGYTDYWEGSVMGFFGKLSRIVGIDGSANLVQALQTGAIGLKRNRVLLVFPEGTRTIDGKIADFKKGAAILACELGVPIVPVGLKGAFEMWPRGGNFRLHPVEVHFGDPIQPADFKGEPDPYSAITETLKSAVCHLAK
jgi:long-chain acyl-CoA synthetase